MIMSNREIIALERQARAQEALAKAIKTDAGKAFSKERELIEKAQGGKKKLAQAEKVLAAAESRAAEIVAEAQVNAAAVARLTQEEIDAVQHRLADEEQRLKAVEASQAARTGTLNDREIELQQVAEALKERETAVEARESETLRRESKVTAREKQAEARETEIKRFEAWRAAAPA